MTRREMALDAFWTERPLVRRFIVETGRTSFSLRELIAFAEQLPDAIFLLLVGNGGAAGSQPPPLVGLSREQGAPPERADAAS
jgi:hypothetical protein